MGNESLINNIPIEDIRIGMSAAYSQTITDADIKAFAGISGDRNPVHLDEKYAAGSRFKKRIAHGMMSASYFSAIFGTKIPGEGCVYTYQALSFKRPVYIGETVEAVVIVTDIDLSNRKVKFKTVCTVNNIVVTDGEAELYVPIKFKKKLINKKNDLLVYKKQIFDLFKDSFDVEMDESLWEWAYINNPNGDPIVSLYFDNDKLVGHYAVIPVSFLYKKNAMNAVLSMTTMVDASYRKYGIFAEQAQEVYDKATELKYKFVYGFPNKKSAPGFKKRLGWVLQDDLYVASFCDDELKKIKEEFNCSISFNTENEKNMAWRLSKPNQNYFNFGSNVLKKYNDEIDIVFSEFDFSSISSHEKYNILLDHDLDKHLDKKVFDYSFGYRLFDTSLEGVEFKKDLIMSDVF